MVVEAIATHAHNNAPSGLSARCAMVPGFNIAVSGPAGWVPGYVNIVVDLIGPYASLKEGDVFDMEFRVAK